MIGKSWGEPTHSFLMLVTVISEGFAGPLTSKPSQHGNSLDYCSWEQQFFKHSPFPGLHQPFLDQEAHRLPRPTALLLGFCTEKWEDARGLTSARPTSENHWKITRCSFLSPNILYKDTREP